MLGRIKSTFRVFLFLAAYGLVFQQARSSERVDLNLVLAIDCSYSVDATEFNLQIHGTAKAFTDPQIINAITEGTKGRIAVIVVQWSGEHSQVVTVPWTVVSNRADAYRLAIAIKSQTRETTQGSTAMIALLHRAAALLRTAPNFAERQVIDVASDGANNTGGQVDNTRNAIVQQGVTINGLSILNEVKYLHHYFKNHVVGGPGSFVQIAKSYRDFGAAIKKKLLREIMGDPVS